MENTSAKIEMRFIKLNHHIKHINKIFGSEENYKKADDLSIPFLEKIIILENFHNFIKPTPIYRINLDNSNILYIKDEGHNGMSVKLRSVIGMFVCGLIYEDIRYHTIIAESSSGNTAIAEAYITDKLLKKFGIKFKAIIDSRILVKDDKCKGKRIMDTADEIEIVNITQDDPSGIYGRLRRINAIRNKNNCFVPDQYDNRYAVFGTYYYLAEEIDWQIKQIGLTWENIDYIVNGISTGAHSIGIVLFAKERNENVKLIGVEQLGSGILSKSIYLDNNDIIPVPYLVGGAGHRFPTLNVVKSLSWQDFWYKSAKVSDKISLEKCFKYKEKYGLNIGPSTGMSLAVVETIAKEINNKNFLVVAPDSMDDYSSLSTWERINEQEEKIIDRLNGLDYRKISPSNVNFFNVYEYGLAKNKNKKYMEAIR